MKHKYNKTLNLVRKIKVLFLGQSVPNNETCFGHSAIYSHGKLLRLILYQISFKLCGNTQQTITNHG